MISIIVPAYNVGLYLEKTLDSLLRQTYKNIEIIVVNDGSTDNTGILIDEYAERFPEKIKPVHIRNSGVTYARFVGIQHSGGEWIGFVDGDDYVEKNMFEYLYRNALKYDADISHCGYQINFADGNVKYLYNTKRIIVQDRNTAIKDLLEGKIIEPGVWNKLFKKELLLKLIDKKIMNMDIKINEDLLMNFYLFSFASKAVFEDFCPYHYLVRTSSVSHQTINSKMVNDVLMVRRIIVNNADRDLESYAKSAYYNIAIDLFSRLASENCPNKNELVQIIKNVLMERECFHYLNKRKKILYTLIRIFPAFYDKMYHIYEKLFHNKQ